jgi:Transposase family tnp2
MPTTSCPQVVGICPGQPEDLDSFLFPFIEELNLLADGVPAYDVHTQSRFLLRAHLVLLSGDTPAISKLLHLSGHSAKFPCHACKIEGVAYQIPFEYQNGPKKRQPGCKPQQYYPLHPPITPPSTCRRPLNSFCEDTNKLPLQSHKEYIRDGTASSNNNQLAREIYCPPCSPFSMSFLSKCTFLPPPSP